MSLVYNIVMDLVDRLKDNKLDKKCDGLKAPPEVMFTEFDVYNLARLIAQEINELIADSSIKNK